VFGAAVEMLFSHHTSIKFFAGTKKKKEKKNSYRSSLNGQKSKF
jgi:hypothetical protein